jgi:peptidoglycan-associated lipoprotein
LVGIAGALVGCSSNPPAEQNTARTESRAPQATQAPVARAPAPTTGAARESRPTADPLTTGELAKRSVFFDYDSNVVKDQYKPLVSAHAKYLGQNKGKHVTIQGNTDERGSREYNLALGQRRADAVKQGMTLLGVPASQIETVSFGEEKPRAQGESEQAWAENRRADIVY